MVAIIRSLLSVALIVSAEAKLEFRSRGICPEGGVTLPEAIATATLDKCIAEAMYLFTQTPDFHFDGCIIITEVKATTETNVGCETVGTVVAAQVKPSGTCQGIYGSNTQTCTATTIADGLLTMKATTGCSLTITTTLRESGGNGGDNTGSSGVTPALTLGCLTAVVVALN